jgi:L-alanine-DL-glutamate epimerase-like enolase superfamily enzyme
VEDLGQMMIQRLETIRMTDHPNLLFVRLSADSGLTGLGETYFGAAAVEAYLHETVAPFLIDRPLGSVEELAASLIGYVGFSSSGAETRGNSAVEIALWDLVGQERGLPLHRLLGDADRTGVPVYNTCAGSHYVRSRPEVASTNWGLDTGSAREYEDLDAFLHRADELAESLLEQSISAMKIWPFDTAAEASDGQYLHPRGLAAGLEPIQKIREAVGDRMDVMIELHGLWNVPMAERIIHALEEYRPRWVEDPIRPHEFSAMGRVSRSTPVPIAAGETLGGHHTHERLISEGSVRVAIADIAWCGGIAEARRIAAYAAEHGSEAAFHDCNGPVVLTASTHLALVTPNTHVQEIVRAFYWGWYADLVTALPPIEAGVISPPDGPGLGLALQPDLTSRKGVLVRFSDGRKGS